MSASGDADEAAYQRTVRWVEWVCLGFAALGVALPLAYASPFFAIYRDGLVAMSGDAALATDSPTLTLCLGMTGGSIAGKWIAHYAVARLGLRRRLRWAREATLFGLLGWLILDSTVSLASGAWLNVAVINPMPPLLLLPLLARLWKGADRSTPGAALTTAQRAAVAAMALGLLSGLAIALGGDGPLFGPWREALGSAHFGGASPPDAARAMVRWFLGPIGGATLGHFVLLGYLVRYVRSMPERTAIAWAAASVLTWFVTDSLWSLVGGAGFNVLMVNLPALVAFVGPLGWAWAAADPSRPATTG